MHQCRSSGTRKITEDDVSWQTDGLNRNKTVIAHVIHPAIFNPSVNITTDPVCNLFHDNVDRGQMSDDQSGAKFGASNEGGPNSVMKNLGPVSLARIFREVT